MTVPADIRLTPSPELIQTALGCIVLTNLCLPAAERQRLCIRLLAVQGVILGLMPLAVYTGALDWHILGVTAVFTFVKGILLPLLLVRTYRKLPPQPPAKPYIGNTLCVLAGLCGFIFSLWLNENLEVIANPFFALVFPVAASTVFTGLLLIVTRKKALTQMFGYLVAENGIYLLGVPMAQSNAVWLEMSILLDILAGVFVMGIAVHHIHQAFGSTDVDRFAGLRD